MPKIVLLRTAGSADRRKEMRKELGEVLARSVLGLSDALKELILLVGIDEPEELAFSRDVVDRSPPWDIAFRGEWADDESFRAVLDLPIVRDNFPTLAGYSTDCVVKKTPATEYEPGPIPGIRMLHPLFFHADLSSSALLRSWRELHGSLAVEAHGGAEYYGQMLVLNSLTPESPGFGGFSEFQFPSRDALIHGYFVSDAARKAVRHDIRHFIAGLPPRIFAKASVHRQL